jgi:hypothetical protein
VLDPRTYPKGLRNPARPGLRIGDIQRGHSYCDACVGGFDALRAERQGASDLDRTGPFDAWYYHESTTRIDKSTDGMEMWNQTEIDKSTAVMEMWHHAEVVVVFFQGDRYDGFLRFGTATTGIAELE